jgi:poly-beta-1,6-N-acetyl-D-glucosamine synthase
MSEYALVTAARDEANYIRYALESVVNQTKHPVRWVIVDDASRDSTAAIVEDYGTRYSFIRLVRLSAGGSERNFARKAQAFGRGIAELDGCSYDYVGNLDADISLDPGYYSAILAAFEHDATLGVAGGIVYTKIDESFDTTDETTDSVAGAIQLFRRKCFADVGSYPALKLGGIDAAAEIIARMRGWRVQKFPHLRVHEQRRTGSVQTSALAARVREGRRFHSLGYDPFFFLLRCLYRLGDRPVIAGSAASLAGFLDAMLRGSPVALEASVVRYLRREQRSKIRNALVGCLWARGVVARQPE